MAWQGPFGGVAIINQPFFNLAPVVFSVSFRLRASFGVQRIVLEGVYFHERSRLHFLSGGGGQAQPGGRRLGQAKSRSGPHWDGVAVG